MSSHSTTTSPHTASLQGIILGAVFAVAAAVFVAAVTCSAAGALSGTLSGRGWAWPSSVYSALRAAGSRPGDPAAAWPPAAGGAHAGPAWLFWLLLGVFVCVLCAAAFKVWMLVDSWLAHRKMRAEKRATPADLGALSLTAHAAVVKARKTQQLWADERVRDVDPTEAAVYVGTLYYYSKRDGIYVQHRDCTLVEGPTGAGKTWRIAIQRCWDAIGFLLVTTTKADLIAATVAERRRRGRVAVFDPERITGWPNPLKWSLLAGCDDPSTALRRAAAFVKAAPMGEVKNASFWEERGTTVLRCYFMAARVGGRSLMDVRRWVNTQDYKNPVRILEEHYPDWAADLHAVATSQSDSISDVYATAAKMLSPLADPAIARTIDVAPEDSIDLEEFVLNDANTLYLASEGDQDSVAPIVATMAAEVYRILNRASQRQPGQRLKVPARLVLDEVNNVAPIPDLPKKMTDSGGRNISIWAFAHNRRQNIDRWGENGGREFTINAPNRIILPGLGDEEELASVSRLFGQRYESIGSRESDVRQRQVITVDEIREMPEDQALMIYRGAPAMIVRLPSVWENAQAKAAVEHSQRLFARIVATGEVDVDITDTKVVNS